MKNGLKIYFLHYLVLLIGLCFFSEIVVAMEGKKKVAEQKDRAAQWPDTVSDREIKKLIEQELNAPGSLNTQDSPMHASIARMVATYNQFLPGMKRWKEEQNKFEDNILSAHFDQNDKILKEHFLAVEEWKLIKDKLEHEGRLSEVPAFPALALMSPAPQMPEPFAFEWCECINVKDRLFIVLTFIRDVLKSYPNLNHQLTYVVMGAGGLLQDILIVQELVSAGYNDLIIDLIPEPWSSIDSWVDKDKHFSALLRLFRNQMAALQEAQIKVDRSVKINVDLYNSVATYGKKRRKNAKINALTIIDLIPLSSEQRALPQDANEIVIAITRQSVVENAIEDQPREEYELMLPLNSANYAYFKPDSEIDSLASLQKTIQVIVRDNIKSVDRIQKMLRNQSILEEAKKNGLDVSVQLFANPYNDLEYLCTYADKSAVMYYANKAVPPSAPEGTTRSDLYGDAGGPYVLDIRKINPRTYRASKILMKALEEEGFERIKP